MNLLDRMRLRTRLTLVFAIILATFAAVVTLALWGTRQLGEADRWNTHTYKVIHAGDQALSAMVNMETGVRGFLLAGEGDFLPPWRDGLTAFGKEWTEAQQLTADNPEQQRRLDGMKARHVEFKAIGEELIAIRRGPKGRDEVINAFAEGRDKTVMDAFRVLHKEFVGAEEKLLAERSAQAAQMRNLLTAVLAGGLLLAIVAGVVLGTLVTRSVVRQLGGEPADAADVAKRVADGDLSVQIEVRQGDQASLLAALKRMQESLSSIVNGVRQNADSVATASGQISQGNSDLSSRTEEQASALQQTAASMKQLASTVQQNAANAEQGNQLANTASQVAVKGGEVVGQVVQTMKGINDSSRKIADIIGVIDGIAFQTNILALNAAVEAARAGEQGRGFAVVAGEVRTLAQRSADAAKEIKGLITASVERVEQGSALVDQAGATMDEVVSSIRRVTDLMGEISAASREQSAGVAQIGDAVTQMDQATQQNAALVEESAAAADSLKSQAQQLVGAVSVFKLGSGHEASNATIAVGQPAVAKVARPTSVKPVMSKTRPAAAPVAATKTGTDDWQSF
jgi:methyl-accepting chemotaxis protein